MSKLAKRTLLSHFVTGVLALASGVFLWGQNSRVMDRSTALEQKDSRAERAAEQLVSLSADKILSILRDETGLLLQVKKSLVRKAFEQGRLLDPKDLTDEALFRLIREDENVRVLATREIEDREYVRAKPTREELDQSRVYTRQVRQANDQNQADQNTQLAGKRPPSQEEAYWSKREVEADRSTWPYGAQPVNPPSSNDRLDRDLQEAPSDTYPQTGPSDQRRTLQRTEAQPLDDYDGAQSDSNRMARIQPDEIPGLLNASVSDRSNTGSGARESSPGARGNALPGNSLPSSNPNLDVPQPNRENGLSRESRLDNRWRTPFPPYGLPKQPMQPALRHRPNPYADVPSLYDLYAQYAKRSPVLERFGEDIFRNGTGNAEQLPMDMPAGLDYVVGPGDGLSIELYGGVSQRLQRVVDREGRVALPEVGTVQVSGRNLGDVQHIVQLALRSQFRDAEADVSLARIRTVRVYVVGDVERPGAYDVSSLSTPLNAVFSAGGPTSRGSLRLLKHYRGKELVQEIDVYDLLLHGIRSDVKRIESGDTVLVPPLGAEITIEGMVQRPAIYELGGEKTLAQALELAGGVLPTGTLRHVDVERLESHESRTMLRLDIPENNNQEAVNKTLEEFAVQDGDKIKISPILPYADKTVYLDGHVSRPGKFAYRDGMRVSDLVKSYSDLLPEPSQKHAEVIRLNPPDYTPTVIAFHLGQALAGENKDDGQNLVLKPFDTVRIFGRFDFEDPPVVTVFGEVRDPGDHITNGAARLRDAVYLAGGTTADAMLDDAQVFRSTEDGKLKVFSVKLSKALAGDDAQNIPLQPNDRVFIHRNLSRLDPPTVTIQGEVARPGKYPLGDDLSAVGLVQVAGGLKRGAYTETADLTRYQVQDGNKVVGEHSTVPLAAALAGQPDSDVRLRDGDVLTVGELTGWHDVGATITVKGEVVHPGTYGIQEGERLSSILERAGGLRADAYPYGAIFQREQVRDIEDKNRAQLIQQVQQEGTQLRATPDGDPDQKLVKAAALSQWQTTLERLQNTPPAGRLVIHISKNSKRWVNGPSDIQVRAGDVIYIPKRPNIVMVDGSVYNPTAITFKPGRTAGWYLSQAGGPTNMGNKKAVFVIRADGSVVGGAGGLFNGGVEKSALEAGDMVVVPEKAFSANSRWKSTLEGAQLAYAVGIAIQVAKSF